MKGDTTTVRMSKEKAQELKANAVAYGGTMRSLLERGADLVMSENAVKGKKKK